MNPGGLTQGRGQTGSPAKPGASDLTSYLVADDRRAWWQVINSVVPFLVTWFLMYQSLAYSYGLTLALALPAAGFLLRIFLLQHDLGHGSLFRSRRLNEVLGSIFPVLTVIPYHHWRRIHLDHHSHAGNLDLRGPGCVMILTVDEYLELSPARRRLYRLRSNPFVVLILGAPYLFLLVHRVPYGTHVSRRRERWSVHLTNLAILGAVLALIPVVGLRQLVMVHLPILWLYSSATVWLFLLQHGFEDTYWERTESWDFFASATDGSSYYQLPRILQWFSLNAGFHHVHHLSPRVPNYRLERCHAEVPELRRVRPMTLRDSLKVPWLALWDEERKRLIDFRTLASKETGVRSPPNPSSE